MKRFDRAKQRLAAALTPGEREELMAAMLADVIAALSASGAAHELLLVTSEPAVAAPASAAGARVVSDEEVGDHSTAALTGIAEAVRRGADRVLLLAGDCPLADGRELDALLRRPPRPDGIVGVAADRAGRGTNALLLSPPSAIRPAFGPGSFARHRALARASGVPWEALDAPSLALDVDTPGDLAALQAALGGRPPVAAHTAAVLRRLAPAERSA